MKYKLLILTMLLSFCGQKQEAKKLIEYVNVFTGTDGKGNTYPGVALPFGMVQLSPDNGLGGWDRIAGYFWQDSTIAGFSHKHLSGTGAGDMYDILIMPVNSRFSSNLWKNKHDDYRAYSKFSHKQETGMPGYYSVDLLSFGIKAELTATDRVGFSRFTFPEDSCSEIIIDLGYALNWDKPTETHIKIIDPQTIAGYRFSTGWAADQKEFFVMKFSEKPLLSTLYENGNKSEKQSVKASKSKIILRFETKKTKEIVVKTALSSVSIEGAFKNMNAEGHIDFNQAVENAKQKWEQQLSCIKIKASEYYKQLFYTNLYHCFLTPSLHSDIDGKYKAPNGKTAKAIDFKRYDTFSLWDTYRALHPLYTIVCPDKVEDFVKSFLAHYDETSLLPVWSMAGNETNMMLAYHSVPVIVDAYLKGIPVNAEKAYEACKNTALSNAWDLEEYKSLGYVPCDGKSKGHWSVSKTLEYAYDDWCIAQFAKALNKKLDYELFTKRSHNWENLYDNNSTFFRPKNKNGKFIDNFTAKEYSYYFCESNAWQYVWHVNQHIDLLIDKMSKKTFSAKLDSMFEYYPEADDKLPIFSTGMIGQYAHGNEPSHHVAYLFNKIGKARKTQKLTRQIINNQYSTKPDGYCGNEDCGQMSAWLVCSALGFYPVNPVGGTYDLTSPIVNEAEILLQNGKKFIIKTQKTTKNSIFIKKIMLNGKKYDKLTVNHKQIMQGGNLLFVLDD